MSVKVPLKYLPSRLSNKDRAKIAADLAKSKRLYKRGKYYTRRQVASYPHRKSSHILNARHIYGIDKIRPSRELAAKTGCSIKALQAITKKGQGAYFSSGSRPNQTAHSWGYARLASAITGGKSAVVDFDIINKGCNHKTSKAYKMALKAKTIKRRHTRKIEATF
uniref:DUF5824 domain-containing protein n=1 Tax=viral metagenome TaxID=1070528 RepID=A0A6C0BWF4_9ZZZZ